MLTVLNFCHLDRNIALNLLKWMGELGGCKNHDLILQTNIIAASGGMHQELHLTAQEVFGKVEFRVLDRQEERQWPWAANNAWRDYVFFSRMKVARPWLWMEPDCVPVSPDWLDKLDSEYLHCNKPFMGDEVTRPGHWMSGVGVYPAYVTEYTKVLPSLGRVPWDQFMAKEIVPNAHFTELIQHVWNVELGKPETIPTFPTVDSLKLLRPECVLFHRNKDGTLIERLRDRKIPNATAVADSRSLVDRVSPAEPSLAAVAPNPEVEALKAEIERLRKLTEEKPPAVSAMTPNSRQAQSERMKKYWADKRKKKAEKTGIL